MRRGVATVSEGLSHRERNISHRAHSSWKNSRTLLSYQFCPAYLPTGSTCHSHYRCLTWARHPAEPVRSKPRTEGPLRENSNALTRKTYLDMEVRNIKEEREKCVCMSQTRGQAVFVVSCRRIPNIGENPCFFLQPRGGRADMSET